MKKKKDITELDLFLPVYKVTTLITEMSQRFPKCYKTNIADTMINKMIQCCDLLIKEQYGESVRELLELSIGSISILLRLCVDLKIISVGKFAEITLITEDINNILNPETRSLK